MKKVKIFISLILALVLILTPLVTPHKVADTEAGITKWILCRWEEGEILLKVGRTDFIPWVMRSKANTVSVDKVGENVFNKIMRIGGYTFGRRGGTPFDLYGFAGLKVSSYTGEFKYIDIDPCSNEDEVISSDYGQYYSTRYEPQSNYAERKTTADARTVQYTLSNGKHFAHVFRDGLVNSLFSVSKFFTSLSVTLVGVSFMDISSLIGFDEATQGKIYTNLYDGIFTPLTFLMILATAIYLIVNGIIRRQYREALVQGLLKTILIFALAVGLFVEPTFLSLPNKLATAGQSIVLGGLGEVVGSKNDICAIEESTIDLEADRPDDEKDQDWYDQLSNNMRSLVGCRMWEAFVFQPWTMAQWGDRYENLSSIGAENESWTLSPDVDLGNNTIKSNWSLFQLSTQTDLHTPRDGITRPYVNGIQADWFRVVDAVANVNYKDFVLPGGVQRTYTGDDLFIYGDNLTELAKNQIEEKYPDAIIEINSNPSISGARSRIPFHDRAVNAVLLSSVSNISHESLEDLLSTMADNERLILISRDTDDASEDYRINTIIDTFAATNQTAVSVVKWQAPEESTVDAVEKYTDLLAATVSKARIGAGRRYVSLESLNPFPSEVEEYRGYIQERLNEKDAGEYIDVAMALLWQESGGRGDDPFQASEGHCGAIGCITDPAESAKAGMDIFMNHYQRAVVENGLDIWVVLAAYNFGGSFIDYVIDNGESTWSLELALGFQEKQGKTTGFALTGEVARLVGLEGVKSTHGSTLYPLNNMKLRGASDEDILAVANGQGFSGAVKMVEVDEEKTPTTYWEHWIGNDGGRADKGLGSILLGIVGSIPILYFALLSAAYSLSISIIMVLAPIFLLLGLWAGTGRNILNSYLTEIVSLILKKIGTALLMVLSIIIMTNIMGELIGFGFIKTILMVGIAAFILIKSKNEILNKVASFSIGGADTLGIHDQLSSSAQKQTNRAKTVAGIAGGYTAARVLGAMHAKEEGTTARQGSKLAGKAYIRNQMFQRSGQGFRSGTLEAERLAKGSYNHCLSCGIILGDTQFMDESGNVVCASCAEEDFDKYIELVDSGKAGNHHDPTTRECDFCGREIIAGEIVATSKGGRLLCSDCNYAETSFDKNDPFVYQPEKGLNTKYKTGENTVNHKGYFKFEKEKKKKIRKDTRKAEKISRRPMRLKSAKDIKNTENTKDKGSEDK